MPRLTADQWATIRAEREAGASMSELSARFGVDKAAICRRAKAEKWGDGTDVAEVIRRKVNEKVNGVSTADAPKRRAQAIDAAADRSAAVVRKHQEEWEDHRARFGSVPQDFEQGKLAKISSEMLRIRQEGERRAWGLEVAQEKSEIVVTWE